MKIKQIMNARSVSFMLTIGLLLPSYVGAQMGIIVDVNSNSTTSQTTTGIGGTVEGSGPSGTISNTTPNTSAPCEPYSTLPPRQLPDGSWVQPMTTVSGSADGSSGTVSGDIDGVVSFTNPCPNQSYNTLPPKQLPDGTWVQPMSVESSAQVKTSQDLIVFGSTLAQREENVSTVDFESEETESKVVVSYNHRGKLFGFIPVTVRSRTVVTTGVNNEVEVNSTLPWWAFLVANENFSKAQIESQIMSNKVITGNAQASASAQVQALIAEATIGEIEAQATAAASLEN
jgi:hypothetical protein